MLQALPYIFIVQKVPKITAAFLSKIKPFVDHICMSVIPAMFNAAMHHNAKDTTSVDPDILGEQDMCFDYPFGDA